MFGTIRKHQTWLWLVIVTITIGSFVFFFSPNQKAGQSSGRTSANYGSIDGQPITYEAFHDAEAEVHLHYFLSHGEWADHDPGAKQLGFDGFRETYYQLFLNAKCAEMGIKVGSKAVGETAADLLRSLSQAGVHSPEDLEQKLLSQRNLKLADFQRMIRHKLELRELMGIVGMSGRLTTAQEAEALYKIENEESSGAVAIFTASNYIAGVTVTPELLGQFFTNQMARYRIADRVQVSYVKFPAKDFNADAQAQIAKLTNFNELVDNIYRERGTNYYSEAKSPADAKAKIRDEYELKLAIRAAHNRAALFADELLNVNPVNTATLTTLATEGKLTVQTSAPFTVQEGPADFEVPPAFATRAFKLTEAAPFDGPIDAADGVYVIAFKKKFASEIPTLDSIRVKVLDDLKLVQAIIAARMAATNLVGQVASGKTFAEAAAAVGNKPVALPNFALTTRSLPEVEKHIALGRLQEAALSVPVGKTSGYIPTDDGAIVLHIASRTPVSDAKLRADLPGFLAQVRNTRQNEAFNEWFRTQAERSLRDTPLAHQAQAQR